VASEVDHCTELPSSRRTAAFQVIAQSKATARLIWACVLFICAVMVWGGSKGYDFSDEAFDLITIAHPYDGVSDFGRIWHVLYVLAGGSVAIMRLACFAILSACGILFAFTALRFSGAETARARDRLTVAAGVTACVSWQYTAWKPTPDYNMLDLSALLLFFSALLMSELPVRSVDKKSGSALRLFVPSLLCGLSLAILVLTKATTAVLAVSLGLLWLFMLRPSRPMLRLGTAAGTALLVLSVSMIAIDGSISAFIEAKVQAVMLLIPPQGGALPHGIDRSLTGQFFKPLWKVAEVASFSLVLLGLGLSWSWSVIPGRNAAPRQWLASALAFLIAALVAWSRFEDLQAGQTFLGYRVWRLPLILVSLAFCLRLVWLVRFHISPRERKLAIAACILMAAPAAYSFGSDSLLIWHMMGGGIFWAGAMILLAGIAPQISRRGLLVSVALLCGATGSALLASVIAEPGRIGKPLWQQTVSVRVGPRHSLLSVNRAAADYITAFQHAAGEQGFAIGTPVIDLSEEGPGLTFALGGTALGQPPWLMSDGDLTNESERQQTLALEAAGAPRKLDQIPRDVLRRAWIITGDPAYLHMVQPAVTRIGLNFPMAYRLVYRRTRNDLGRTQALWKPL
jgi:hypothetical protein